MVGLTRTTYFGLDVFQRNNTSTDGKFEGFIFGDRPYDDRRNVSRTLVSTLLGQIELEFCSLNTVKLSTKRLLINL